jgi:tetratricopeptide (TPR) repeat protein
MVKKIFLFALFFSFGLLSKAQTMTENDYIRRGNRHYADSLFEQAEIEYRKALELNPQSVDAMYNLGNALFNQIPQSQEKAQEKGEEAMQQYATAAKLETDKKKLAQIYHNIGTLAYMAQQYPQSVAAYKEALRNQPNDNETRYNLAKAMHMLKQQDQQQQQNQDQQQEQQQEQKQEQQEQQQQNQQQEQQEQQQQQQNQQQQDNNKQDKTQQQQQQNEQMSKDNAQQMLDAFLQDEKDTQEKVKKAQAQQQQRRRTEKEW